MYYGYGFGYDPLYLALVIISTILGVATQGYIKSTYAKWSKVPLDGAITGADVARRMLSDQNVGGVGIEGIGGELTDNYDPRTNVLHLSSANLHGGSVASAAVACHEAGHAVQHARNYVPVKIRSALVPVVNFTSNAWVLVFILGMAVGQAGLLTLAIALRLLGSVPDRDAAGRVRRLASCRRLHRAQWLGTSGRPRRQEGAHGRRPHLRGRGARLGAAAALLHRPRPGQE